MQALTVSVPVGLAWRVTAEAVGASASRAIAAPSQASFRLTRVRMRVGFNALPGVYMLWVAGVNGEGDFTLRAAVAAPP